MRKGLLYNMSGCSAVYYSTTDIEVTLPIYIFLMQLLQGAAPERNRSPWVQILHFLRNLLTAEDVEGRFLKEWGFGGRETVDGKKMTPQNQSFSQQHACLNISSLCEIFLHIRVEFPTETKAIQLSAG